MINKYHHKHLTWVDLESPSKEEIRQIMEEYNIHPLAAEELLLPSAKQKVDLYKDFIFLSLHFPVFKQSHKGSCRIQEIDFVIGKNFIVTTRFDTVDPLHQFSKVFEVNSILDKSHLGDHAGFIFYHMMKQIYRSLVNELESIEDSLGNIEQKIFSGKEKEMVFKLSEVSRNLLQFKSTMASHDNILESFEEVGQEFFQKDFGPYLRAVTGEYLRVANTANAQMEVVKELRETNNSLLSTKQNEVTKVLSVFAFIAIPLSIISSLFQIDAVSRPIVGQPNDFWIIAGGLVVLGAILYLFFRLKKWL